MLAAARAKLDSGRLIRGRTEALPFSDASLDVVFSTLAFADPWAVYCALCEAEPGGMDVTVDAFRAAVEAHDLDAIMACFTDDVTFHSPIVFKPYHGKDELRMVLAGVLQVFEDFCYEAVYRSEDGGVLRFRARVGDRTIDGIDMLRFRQDGLCDDFTVMVRPYSGATLLRERMAALLEAAG